MQVQKNNSQENQGSKFSFLFMFMKTRFLSLILALIFFQIDHVKAAIITVNSNKALPLCQELKKVLEDLANNPGKGSKYPTDGQFNFPKKYKNFKTLKWEDVDVSEIGKYVASAKKLEEINDFNKKFEGKAKMLIQKTMVDVDFDGKDDVFLRFKSSDRNYYNKYSQKIWKYYISDISFGDVVADYNREGSTDNADLLFYYKGKVYQSQRRAYTHILITEFKILRSFNTLYNERVCDIDIKLTRQEAIGSGIDPKPDDRELKKGFF